MTFDPPHDQSTATPVLPQSDSADDLRKQAAACRRLALQSRTRAGRNGLDALGDHFDSQAYRLDPSSLRQ